MPVHPRVTLKRRFIKETVVGFGFLSGLWVHLGFDPSTFVYRFLQQLLINARPEYTQAITTTFFALPIIITCIGWIGAYRRAGFWGVAAVGLAFAAGILLNWHSTWMFVLALMMGFLAAKR